jgi:hypothetical protein
MVQSNFEKNNFLIFDWFIALGVLERQQARPRVRARGIGVGR